MSPDNTPVERTPRLLHPPRGSRVVKAAAAATIALFLMMAFQAAKDTLFPGISQQESHVVTVLFCAVVTFVLAVVILRRHQFDLELLNREHANFEVLIERLPGLACIINPDEKFARWNSRFQTTLGYSSKELASMPAPETLAEDYRTLVPETMGLAWAAGAAEMEAAWVTKAGVRIPCYLTGVRIFMDGQPCILSVGIDLSKRKNAEEALRKSEEQYRRLLSNLPDVTWTCDLSRKLSFVSPNLYAVLGYTPEEVLQRGPGYIHAHVHPADAPLAAAGFDALFLENRIFDLKYRVRHKDGRWVWIRNRALRTYRQDGVLLADGILSDITEHKHAEEADSQLASIVTSTSDAIIGKTADGTIRSWNPAAETMFGYSPTEAVGKHISMLIPPERLQEVPAVLGRLGRGERIGRFDSVCIRKDGSRFDVSLAISPIVDAAGTVLGISTIANDISLRKRAERELLLAKEAAETAARAKTEFLANISHELRTPMNGILGMTELALETQLTAEQHEYLLTIQSSGAALLRLIAQLLDFSKVDSGRLELNLAPFDLGDTVQQTVRPLLFQAQQVGLVILCQIDARIPQEVIGDAGRLRQVLLNVVGNAIKFTYQGKVEIHVVCNTQTEDEIELLFSVSDTGIGIPLAKHAAIFEPFTQTDGSTTRKYGGTGLGLAISSQLVKLMGGKMWVDSAPGRGSTFSFTTRLGLTTGPQLHRDSGSRATSLAV